MTMNMQDPFTFILKIQIHLRFFMCYFFYIYFFLTRLFIFTWLFYSHLNDFFNSFYLHSFLCVFIYKRFIFIKDFICFYKTFYNSFKLYFVITLIYIIYIYIKYKNRIYKIYERQNNL